MVEGGNGKRPIPVECAMQRLPGKGGGCPAFLMDSEGNGGEFRNAGVWGESQFWPWGSDFVSHFPLMSRILVAVFSEG